MDEVISETAKTAQATNSAVEKFELKAVHIIVLVLTIFHALAIAAWVMVYIRTQDKGT